MKKKLSGKGGINRFFRGERNREQNPKSDVRDVQNKFKYFLNILESNNLSLKIISDMEEKSQGEYIFDRNYIDVSVESIRKCVDTIIDNLTYMGGEKYSELRDKYEEIDEELRRLMHDDRTIAEDDYVYPISKLRKEDDDKAGAKMARLGELRSGLGLRAPDGFAITAWAYKRFIDYNNLHEKIASNISAINYNDYNDLKASSKKIQQMISESEMPEDLALEIISSYRENCGRGKMVAVRSSAIGEDAELSFAGQYSTYLNVKEDEIIDRYKDVISSKFSPRAIYYFLSHKINEADLAMSVGCLNMIDAAVSGVVYTRNPVAPDSDYMIVNSIYGLCKYLVDGTVEPDVFEASRRDLKVVGRYVSTKRHALILDSEGGVRRVEIDAQKASSPALSDEQIKILCQRALAIEEHYGAPVDIEWSFDADGELYFLQARPLSLIKNARKTECKDVGNMKKIIENGLTGCPGAGAGRIYRVKDLDDIVNIPTGAVVVARRPMPELITALGKISAVVLQIGATASHMVTIAREYRVPTLAGVRDIDKLEDGAPVTVDATHGVIYEGISEKLVEWLRPDFDFFENEPLFLFLRKILEKISPLNLIEPDKEKFLISRAKTFHDITRYAHQKSMEEMFLSAASISDEKSNLRLKTKMPLIIDIFRLDRNFTKKCGSTVSEDNIDSRPMQAFWDGALEEGWPRLMSKPPVVAATGVSTNAEKRYSQRSFAILSRDFMILSLKMGYHFSTVEAMCKSEPSKNYIKMQFKDGGSSYDRRVRRIRLIAETLKKIGFKNSSKGDFLDSEISYLPEEYILQKLRLLGRLAMMTKQLDMALSNDSVTGFYIRDFSRKLGIE